jgi:hypothetical protein
VILDANMGQVAFMLRRDREGGPSRYDYLCIAPCEARIPEGKARIALAFLRDAPLELKEPVVVSPGVTLMANYRTHAGMRTAGLVVIVLGVVFGGMLGSLGGSMATQGNPVGWGLLAGGSVVGVGSIVAGTIMLTQRDRVSIEVLPPAPPNPVTPGPSGESLRRTTVGEGIALRLRF